MAGSGSFAVTQGNTQFDTSGNATFVGSATANSFVKSGGTSSQYLMADGSVTTGVASHNHNDLYYLESESNAKFTSTDGADDDYTFEIQDEGNFTGNKWYHVASLNSANGGLHIRGAILNHVENFAFDSLSK